MARHILGLRTVVQVSTGIAYSPVFGKHAERTNRALQLKATADRNAAAALSEAAVLNATALSASTEAQQQDYVRVPWLRATCVFCFFLYVY